MKKFFTQNKNFVWFVIIILLLSSLVALMSCQKNSTQEDMKGVIGFTGYNLSLDFFSSMEVGIRHEVDKLGYEYIAFDQESDETKQIATFKELIRREADAIIVSPINPDVLAPLVEQAHEKGIPVIVNDIGGGNSNYDVIVVSDNWQGGQLAADYTASFLKDSNGSREVAILACEPTAIYAARRGMAYRNTIETRGFNVVSEKTAFSRQEDGYIKMKEIIEEYPNIEAVFAENDPMAVGAANALAEMGRDDILVVGFNGDQIAIDAIQAGLMQATVMQNPGEMGRITAMLADRILEGKEISFDDETNREIYVKVSLLAREDLATGTEQ